MSTHTTEAGEGTAIALSASASAPSRVAAYPPAPHSPGVIALTRELTESFIRALNARPTLGLWQRSGETRIYTLERAIDLLDAQPNGLLDLTQTVEVEQATDGRLVRHTVFSAAFHACTTLQVGKPAGPVSARYLPQPTVVDRVSSFMRSVLEPRSSLANEPHGRHEIQSRLWNEIRKREWIRPQAHTRPVEQEAPTPLNSSNSQVKPTAVQPEPLLHMALQELIPGAPTITELIERYGCDPNEFNSAGLAPIHFILTRHVSTETRLGFAQRLFDLPQEKRFDVNLVSRQSPGNSALHLAAKEKDSAMFMNLLNHGADPTIRDQKNQNAFYALATNVHSYTPYRPDRLEKVLRFLLDLLAQPATAGTPEYKKRLKVAQALFDLVEKPGFPSAAGDLSGFGSMTLEEAQSHEAVPAAAAAQARTASVSFTPSMQPSDSVVTDLSSLPSPFFSGSSTRTPAVSPGLLHYDRTHIYEILDEKLNLMLREIEIAKTKGPVYGPQPQFRRPCSLEGIQPYAFHHAVGAVMRPAFLAELDPWLIPDMAKTVAAFLFVAPPEEEETAAQTQSDAASSSSSSSLPAPHASDVQPVVATLPVP